ncbi:MAG: hypothetical protein LC632_04510 [Xanthomonadaceae bacterium]|nr:hypothetical protein [Xanthomonadaceae bacterium]
MMRNLLLLILLAGPFTMAGAQQVGSAPVRGAIELNAPDLVLPKHTLAARQYRLAPLGADELDRLRARNAEQKLLHVGIGRALPEGAGAGIPLDALSWHALPDGSRATTVEFASPEAAALRVSLDAAAFPAWLTVRTYAAATDGQCGWTSGAPSRSTSSLTKTQTSQARFSPRSAPARC